MTGRVVLVTGGAAGIGLAAAQRFAADGDQVVIADIDRAAAEARAAPLGAGVITVDIGAPGEPERMVRDCVRQLGRLDVLVNNAGVIDAGGTAVTEQKLEAFRRLLAINLLGMERASAEAACVMRRQAKDAFGERGIIVNLASGAALRAIPLRNGYSASKAGVVAVTRSHACAWAWDGIRVNAVAPGYTRTDLVEELIRRGRVDPASVDRRIPMGRMGTPAEMAASIAFLAAPASRATIGTMLIVDGGSTAYGGSGDAPVVRGAPPAPTPPGRPVYVVAGATRLGRACAQYMQQSGAELCAVDGPAEILAAAARFGRLDGVINTAGTDDVLDGRLTLPEQLERHVDAQFLAAQAAGHVLLAQGFGAVVNLTMMTGQVAGVGTVAGSAAAAAIGMLTRTMACEWGGSGLRVNALMAGPMVGGDPALVSRIPLGRLIDPMEVAATAAFLVSPESGYVSGSMVAVDGGLSSYAGPDMAFGH